MRFETSTSTPPPTLAPSWRMILWAMTLMPALLILAWSLRQARLPKPDVVSAGISEHEAQRLKRILKDPPEGAASRLQDGAVRVVETSPDSAENKTLLDVSSDARLDKSILTSIKDNSFGVTAAEKPAYDAILAKVRNVPLADLERMAHKDIPFAVLMLEADRFRGELLTIEGDIRRLNRMSLAEAEASAVETIEAWMFTPDSGLNPYRVILATRPESMPLGDELKPPVHARITGYFFKRFSYATANDFHTAPLLLANSLTPLASRQPATALRANNSRSLTILAISILVAFVVGGIALEMFARRRSHRPKEAPDSPPDFAWLKRK